MNADYDDQSPQRWPGLPIVVLVDGRSASASEIVAGALQDHDRAVIVGRPTYGKGSAQTVYPIAGEGGLKLTTARWFTPVGRSINRFVPREDTDFGDEQKPEDQHKEFKTDGGRTVFGGGGITPDVPAGDTVLAPATAAFQAALGTHVAQFRDAITEYALALKASGAIKRPNFGVTPQMRAELWKRAVAHGVDIPRGVYDDAAAAISQLLGYEIERYVFGPQAEFRRRAEGDSAINTAEKLLAGNPTPAELLRRAAEVPKPDTK
jgi:carboxyl-terminal processing protease